MGGERVPLDGATGHCRASRCRLYRMSARTRLENSQCQLEVCSIHIALQLQPSSVTSGPGSHSPTSWDGEQQ